MFRNSPVRPRSAIIDLAGPITGDEVHLTNADWVIRPRDVMARLGIEHVVLLNDFEALALALTALSGDDLVAIGGGADAPGAKVVLGPGTGLGVGALIEAGGLWVPVPGEGGHVALGPDEPDEFPLWENIELEHGRISGETILCGRGLVRLYRAVAKMEKARTAAQHAGEDHQGGARRFGRRRGKDRLAVDASARAARRRHGAGVHGARRRLYRRRHSAAHPAVHDRAESSAAPSRRKLRTRS